MSDEYKFSDTEFQNREVEPKGFVYPEPLQTIPFSESGGISTATAPPERQVTSVYSTRPINDRDFLFQSVYVIGTTSPSFIHFNVPQGYIAVINSFSVSGSLSTYSAISWLPLPNISFTLLNGDTPDPFYSNMNLAPNGAIDVHKIIESGGSFGIKIDFGAYDSSVTYGYDLAIGGNFILSDGLPANFEIGTKRIIV